MLATHTRTQPVLQSAAVSVYALESQGEVGSQADPRRRSVILIQHSDTARPRAALRWRRRRTLKHHGTLSLVSNSHTAWQKSCDACNVLLIGQALILVRPTWLIYFAWSRIHILSL